MESLWTNKSSSRGVQSRMNERTSESCMQSRHRLSYKTPLTDCAINAEDPRAQPNFAPPVPVKLLNPSFEYLPTFPAPKFIRRDVLFLFFPSSLSLSLPSRINENTNTPTHPRFCILIKQNSLPAFVRLKPI